MAKLGYSAPSNRLFLGDGRGHFTDGTGTQLPLDRDSTRAALLVDLDRNGDLDLVFGNSGQSRLHVNDGRGRFVDETLSRLPLLTRDTWALAAADVDADGDLDLVLGGGGVLPLVVVSPPSGEADLPVQIPTDPRLIGATLYAQATVIADLAFPPVGWCLTNSLEDVIDP